MWRKAIRRLTLQYSLFFLVCLAFFNVGLSSMVGLTFANMYVGQVEHQLSDNDADNALPLGHAAVEVAAKVAIDQFHLALVLADLAAVVFIPVGSYVIARRSLRPLIESSERQKRFVTNASHELRTPLAVLSGEFDLALKRDRTKAFYRHAITSSKQEVERLTRLTNQLLELNRIETQLQDAPLNKEMVSVSNLIKATAEKYTSQAKDDKHHIILDLPQEPAFVALNPTLFQTAFGNLVENALKYSKPATPINLRIDQRGDTCIIEVESTPKMPLAREELDRLFERFYQVKDEAVKSGFGLGLAIVQSVMQAHGGSVEVRNTPVGTIKFLLKFNV